MDPAHWNPGNVDLDGRKTLAELFDGRSQSVINHLMLGPGWTAIEDDLQFVMGQLARVPTRGDLAKAALGIIFCSAVLTTALTWIAWH
jgi:predicted dithiol-disulfide oxidoreductase (DUF899 family)